MLSFRIYPMENLNGPYSSWYDKSHLLKGKTAGWSKDDHERGCTTVWLINDEHFGKMDSDKDYISHKIENLSLFLKEIRLLKSQ